MDPKRIAVIGIATCAIIHVLGRTSGSRFTERRRRLPGDDIVAYPTIVTNHASTLPGPPAEVWPWLVQMGWHQGGWYTAAWVDRLLFPANRPSADHIIADLQNRAIGDFIPDGPPESECGFVIDIMEREETLVLHSTTHLPLRLRRVGAQLDWTWTFHLTSVEPDRTRLLFRTRGTITPRWLWVVYQLVIVPADFVMAGQMMRGLVKRVRSTRATGPAAPTLTRP